MFTKNFNVKEVIFYLLLILSLFLGWDSFIYLRGIWLFLGVFVSGLCAGIFLMFISLNVKNDKIKLYKRELEKESVSSDENAAKVKVLEQKIQVLEKALDEALNK